MKKFGTWCAYNKLSAADALSAFKSRFLLRRSLTESPQISFPTSHCTGSLIGNPTKYLSKPNPLLCEFLTHVYNTSSHTSCGFNLFLVPICLPLSPNSLKLPEKNTPDLASQRSPKCYQAVSTLPTSVNPPPSPALEYLAEPSRYSGKKPP